ncbi:MAG: exodeoxyribonuclease VII large subunit [Anaerolineae bacterium]|nr:exodeoxyribonuclease VII large subunit [Anaerolineae bacterium]MDW8069949.1 exodeoxyribonuclease VII large subunit [Anaerolineae bacterium]
MSEQLTMFPDQDAENLPRIFTVSEVTQRIRTWLEADQVLQDLWLVGEVSNWRQSPVGHFYFTLKDEQAALRCVLWRSNAHQVRYLPSSDGETVLAHGYVSVYDPQGVYQLYVDELQPLGVGSWYARFEELKRKLEAEGLFARPRRPLPRFPRRIGVVTSPSGAVLRDILTVLRRRYPLAEVILAPTLVQGEDAPPQIVRALRSIARVPGVDVIILARGGGSIEDLWAFNDERVARAIAASPVPVVCGVGHETDFTIADFVADMRAPTPSAAAELVTPDRGELQRRVQALRRALAIACSERIARLRRRFEVEKRALRQLSPRATLQRQRQHVDELALALMRALRYALALHRERLSGLRHHLAALNPVAILTRGYAIVRRQDDRRVVTQVAQVSPGDRLSVQVSDGTFMSIVD